ncbi:MAG: OadG family protein [Clostridiales bacterium]|nr:OadG family protein [Clostridiales bacterium]
MNEFFEMVATTGTPVEKGLLVTLIGMLGVFIVLIIFYFMIGLMQKIFPAKPEPVTAEDDD